MKSFLIFLAVVVLIVAGCAVYYFLSQPKTAKDAYARTAKKVTLLEEKLELEKNAPSANAEAIAGCLGDTR